MSEVARSLPTSPHLVSRGLHAGLSGASLQVQVKDDKLHVAVIFSVIPPGRTFFGEFLILRFFFSLG